MTYPGFSLLYIVGIHKWILQKIKDEIPEVKGDSHDAFGLDQYLQNPYAIGEDEQEEYAYKNYEPIELETETVEGRRKPIKINVLSVLGGRFLRNGTANARMNGKRIIPFRTSDDRFLKNPAWSV